MTEARDASVQRDFGRAYVSDLSEVKGSAAWKAIFAGQRKDHHSLEIIEQTIRQDFEYHYLVLEDGEGKVRGIQPFFVRTQDLLGGTAPGIRRLMQRLRSVAPRLLTLRTLMVGLSICEGQLGATPEDSEWCAAALHSALPETARRYGAFLIVLKEFPSDLRQTLACFSSDGYTRIPSMPYAMLDLNFTDFDEYMQNALSRSFRKNLRRKFKSAARAVPVTMQVLSDITPCINEVYPLYIQVYERSTLRFEKLTPEYLCRYGRECPEKARFFIWRQEGRPVALSVCTVHKGALWDEYVGLDYGVALDLHLYFLTFRDLINWCCQQGLKRYYSSGLNYDPKLHLQCNLVPLDLYVRHLNPLLNVILKPILRLVQPTRNDRTLKKFRNAQLL